MKESEYESVREDRQIRIEREKEEFSKLCFK